MNGTGAAMGVSSVKWWRRFLEEVRMQIWWFVKKKVESTKRNICQCGHGKCYHGMYSLMCWMNGCACKQYVDDSIPADVAELERMVRL